MFARLFFIACFAMSPLALSPAKAEESSKAVSIAVVDVQQLMTDSKAAKSIQSQGQSLRDSYQKQIEKIESELKDLEKKLVSLPKDTSQEDFLKEREKFQKRLVDGQKEVLELNKKLDRAVATALNKLRDEIIEIVGNIATEKKYDVVLARSDVVIVAKSLDITSTVMGKLNDKLSSIKVKD